MIHHNKVDIAPFLEQFYTKSIEIEQKLNPFLNKIRRDNIISYHHYENKEKQQKINDKSHQQDSNKRQLKSCKGVLNLKNMKQTNQCGNACNVNNQLKMQNTTLLQTKKANPSQEFKLQFNHIHGNSQSPIDEQGKYSNNSVFLSKYVTNQDLNPSFKFSTLLDTPKEHNISSMTNRNYSYNIEIQNRSQTSNKIKKKVYSTLTPRTASDVNRQNYIKENKNPFKDNLLRTGTKTNPKFLKNGKEINISNIQQFLTLNQEINNIQDLDDDFCNYLRLKMLTKIPYRFDGKNSKVKKHLIEDINFQQIEKKFHKSPSAMTKYHNFCEKLLQKSKFNQKNPQLRKLNRVSNPYSKTFSNKFYEKQLLPYFNQSGNKQFDSKRHIKSKSTFVEHKDKEQTKMKQQHNHCLYPYCPIFQDNNCVGPQKGRKTAFKARVWSRKSSIHQKRGQQNANTPTKQASKQLKRSNSNSKQQLLNIRIKGLKKQLSPQKKTTSLTLDK